MSRKSKVEEGIHHGEYLEYTKYSKKLEETPELKSWILPNEFDPYTAKCKYCAGSTLRADRGILLKHARTKKHLCNSNLNVKCRTCLISSKRDSMSCIFTVNEITNVAYTDMISCITGVKITLERDLPSGICSECRMFTVKAYNFQMQVKRADALLHKKVEAENDYEDYDDEDMAFLDYEQLEWEPESCGDNVKSAFTDEGRIEGKTNDCCLCSEVFESTIDLLRHVQRVHPKVVDGSSGRTEDIAADLMKKEVRIQIKGSTDKAELIVTNKRRWKHLRVPSRKLGIKDDSVCSDDGKEIRLKRANAVSNTVLSSVTGSRANGLRSCSIPILGVLDVSRLRKTPVRPQHRCGICSAVFKDATQSKNHSKEHTGSEVIICSLCERVYYKYSHFKRHFVSQHPDLEPVHGIDDTETLLELQEPSAVETIAQYMSTTTIGDVVHASIGPSAEAVEIEAYVQVCGLCGCVILSPEDLSLHNESEHPDYKLRCFYCAKTFTDTVVLKHHKKTCRTREKNYECHTCGARFHVYSALVKHMAGRHMQKFKRWIENKKQSNQYACAKCEQAFQLETQLKRHKCSGVSQDVSICDFCSKVFTKKLYLQRHLKYMHDGNKNKYLCNVCGKGFAVMHQMIVHMRTHTRDFPYKCQLCPKEFATGHAYKYHMRWHTGDTPHVCKECGKRFIRAVSLRNHILIHTGEKPFACDVCEFAFRQQYDLVKHKTKVHGESPLVKGSLLRTKKDPIDTFLTAESTSPIIETVGEASIQVINGTINFEEEQKEKFNEGNFEHLVSKDLSLPLL